MAGVVAPPPVAGEQDKLYSAAGAWVYINSANVVANAITLALMQQIATNKILGRFTGGTGNVELIDCTAAGRSMIAAADAAAQRALLSLGTAALSNTTAFAAASHTHAAADIVSGVLAMSRLATGTPDGTKFVRDDGVLATPAFAFAPSAAATVLTETSVVIVGPYEILAGSTLEIQGTGRLALL